nr:hypothetical protein [Solimonas terrae]
MLARQLLACLLQQQTEVQALLLQLRLQRARLQIDEAGDARQAAVAGRQQGDDRAFHLPLQRDRRLTFVATPLRAEAFARLGADVHRQIQLRQRIDQSGRRAAKDRPHAERALPRPRVARRRQRELDTQRPQLIVVQLRDAARQQRHAQRQQLRVLAMTDFFRASPPTTPTDPATKAPDRSPPFPAPTLPRPRSRPACRPNRCAPA